MNRMQELVASIVRRNPIKDPTTVTFARSGERSAEVLGAEIINIFGDAPEIDILDFGAAAGRLTQPLAKRFPSAHFTSTDVDAEAIEYLTMVAPANCSVEVNGYVPPLRFDSGTFDCIYSLSVWSHFPKETGLDWLSELRRISKPGALLMISTSGRATLDVMRKKSPIWRATFDDELVREGFIYREYRGIQRATEMFPGIAGSGSWGDAFIHPDYIREHWSGLFDVVDIRESGMHGSQDLTVLRAR